jgi:serine/threonine protein kinase
MAASESSSSFANGRSETPPGLQTISSSSSSGSSGSTNNTTHDGSPGLSLVRMLTGRSSKSADAVGEDESAAEELDYGQFKWQKGALLGSGSFGRVHLGLNLDTGELIAVKQVELSAEKLLPEQQPEIRALQSEIGILRNLKHENIVQYLGSSVENNTLNIFLEYVPGGSISSLLRKFGSLPEHLVRLYTKQILQGLRYLHSHKIIHRDIKGANILVDNKGVIKLADFGASKKLEGLVSHGDVASLKGTIYWMAPEVIRQSGYGRQADIWSLGCTVIEMATGRPPWSGEFAEQISALFNIATTNDPPPIPQSLSREARDFLMLCFKRNPRERPTASRLLKHPWIAQSKQAPPSISGPGGYPAKPYPLPRGSSDSQIEYAQQIMAAKRGRVGSEVFDSPTSRNRQGSSSSIVSRSATPKPVVSSPNRVRYTNKRRHGSRSRSRGGPDDISDEADPGADADADDERQASRSADKRTSSGSEGSDTES